MPAGLTTATNKDVDVVGAWKAFLSIEATARTTLLAAWNALDPGGAATTMQASWDTFTSTVRTAFTNAQATLGAPIANSGRNLGALFASFQNILSGGGTVATASASFTTAATAFDNAARKEGGMAKEMQATSARRALPITMEFAANVSPGAEQYEANGQSGIYVDQIVLQSGPEPSHAVGSCKFLAGNKEEVAPRIGARSEGPGADVDGGDRAAVYIGGPGAMPILVGPVVNVADTIDPDGCTFMVVDDKHTLEGITIRGSFHFYPDAAEVAAAKKAGGETGAVAEHIKYNRAGPCRFNPDGRPNCVDSPLGPMFAPYPDYGLEVGEFPGVVSSSDPSKPATGAVSLTETDPNSQGKEGDKEKKVKARLWRQSDIIEYYRFVAYDSRARTYTANYPGFKQLHSGKVNWPKGLGSAILGDDSISGDDRAAAAGEKNLDKELGSGAKVIDLEVDGMDLKSALDGVIASAGGYALYMFPNGDTKKNTMSIVRTRIHARSKESFTKPVIRRSGTYGDQNALVLHSGKIERDYQSAYSSCVIASDNVLIETRVQFDPASLTSHDDWLTERSGSPADYTNTIVPGWSAKEEEGLRQYLLDPDGNIDYEGTPHAWQDATAMFDKVFHAYKINPLWNYLKGTPYENFPRATPHPPILPHLLTWQSESLEGSQKRRLPLPIPVEIYNEANDAWELVTKLDGLELDKEGNFYLTSLRENNLLAANGEQDYYTRTWQGVITDPANIKPNRIRMTVAIQSDVRVESIVGFDDDEINSGTVADPNKVSRTADPNGERRSFSKPYGRQYYADVGTSYRLYLRKGSYPIPESVSTSQLPNVGDPVALVLGAKGQQDCLGTAGSPALLDERIFAQRHAQRRFANVGRPQRSAHLVFKQFVVWRPGTIITKLATRGTITDSVRVDSVLQKLSYSYEEQETVMDCT